MTGFLLALLAYALVGAGLFAALFGHWPLAFALCGLALLINWLRPEVA